MTDDEGPPVATGIVPATPPDEPAPVQRTPAPNPAGYALSVPVRPGSLAHPPVPAVDNDRHWSDQGL